MSSYLKAYDGEPLELNLDEDDCKIACCDCGLVHKFSFETKGKNLIIRTWRDNRATAQLRRHRPK